MTGPGGLKEAGTAVVSRGEGRVRAPCWGYDFAAFSGRPLPPSADERKIIIWHNRKFGTLRDGGDLARPGLARAIRPLLVGSGGAARSRHGSNEPRPPPFVKAVDNAGVAAWMPLAGRRRRCDRSVR